MPKYGDTRIVSSFRVVPKVTLLEKCSVKEIYVRKISSSGLSYGEWVPFDSEIHTKQKGKIPNGYYKATGK